MDQPKKSEQRALNTTPHDGSIILRQNAYADMRPFIEQLWDDRRDMCCNIYLDQFPRGTTGKGATKAEEDTFLLEYFSEREFHLQGGRFLKQVLYAIAKFNEDSVLSHAEKWWRDYNFCASTGMDAAQIRQVLDLHQAANYPDSFLKRVVLLISDGFRRFYGPQDQQSTDAAVPIGELAATPGQQNYQQQHRHRAVSIHDEHARNGSARPRQFHKQEYRGRNRRASMSPMITPLQHMSPSFPDFDTTTSGFVEAQFYTPVGLPMQSDGPFVGYYPPPMYASPLEPRIPSDLLGPAQYPDDTLHHRNGSFSQRLRPRLVDPHSFARLERPYALPYNQRGSHRSSFNSTRPRRSSFRSGDARQGSARENRPFERRVYSDNRNYRIRENRSYSDIAGDHQEAPAEEPALPSLSEHSPVEKEFGKQDSSPKTTEDDSFQTAAETPAATPTEKVLCTKAQSVATSPCSTTESHEDSPHDETSYGSPPDDSPVDGNPPEVPPDGDSFVGDILLVAPSKEEPLCKKTESFSQSPTITTESGDATSIASIGQQSTADADAPQFTVSKPGPKQTESFSPFARRANAKKDLKQKPAKSKSKLKPEPVKTKQSMVDTPVDTSVEDRVETLERNVDVEDTIDASITSPSSNVRAEHDEHDNMNRLALNIEEPQYEEPSYFQTQDDNSSKHHTKSADNEDSSKYHTESATPQMLSTLSSVTALLSGALSSMSSNKAKKGDDSSTASVQNEVPAAAPKKKKSKKNKKKKKKAKTTTQAPDGDSTETLANETPVGSPPSIKMYTLREKTNILDKRLSSLNIREGSIVELHENSIGIGYRTNLSDQQPENLSSKHDELVELSRRKIQEMQEQEKLLKQKKR